ncbi:MAG: rod shape-determining protein MreC [Saprospiraceae bacterium]|nr:rod shape-determining protein MreC [Saprospiraceae bacterium]
MGNVLLLLVRFGYHLMFFLLEGIAIYLIVNYNQSQKEIFINSTNLFSTSLNDKVDGMVKFSNLQQTNDKLQAENARLLERFISENVNAVDLTTIDTLSQDSLKYHLIPATICNSTYTLRNNNLTLCQGSKDGIEPDMGVITDKGLVGIVRNVSPNFSRVMSILHSQSIIDCAIKRNNAHGSLIWDGNNPRILNLVDIPKHISVLEGDTVLTSGYSTIFPKGLLVGTVKSVTLPNGSNSYNIGVELFSDPVTLNTAYVIVNKYSKEQITLESEIINE